MKILTKLTYRYLKLNKSKSIITLISILLVTILLFSISLGASTVREKNIQDAIIENGPQHLKLDNLSYQELDTLKANKDIKKILLTQENTVLSVADYQINLVSMSENISDYFLDFQGDYPSNENELIISRDLAKKGNYTIGNNINNRKIVGIFSKSSLDAGAYTENLFYAYTKGAFDANLPTTYYVFLTSMFNAYDKIDIIAESLSLTKHMTAYGGVFYDNSEINENLLQTNGEFYFVGTKLGIYAIFILILFVISIFGILIIRNAFTISLSERQKQFGALRSIGASKKQIFKMVMLEGIMLSLIAIPLGILLSFSLVAIIISIYNKFMSSMNLFYQIYVYPEFIMLSLIFIMLTIFASAFYPALKASRVTPMEAVRLNNIYKIKKSKENYPLIKKVFGPNGQIAYKNMKRNRKAFTSSTISLCISIILFLVFAAIINFLTDNYITHYDEQYDINVTLPESHPELLDKIKSISSIDEIHIFQSDFIYFSDSLYFTEEYIESSADEESNHLNIFALDDNTYNNYLQNLKIDDKYFGIIINNAKVFEDNAAIELNLVNRPTTYNNSDYLVSSPYMTIDNLYMTDAFSYWQLFTPVSLIVDFATYDYISSQNPSHKLDKTYNFYINAKNYHEFDKEMNQIVDDNPNVEIGYTNYKIITYNSRMQILAFTFIIYSVLIFIALISITTIFSSLNTSISVREKEFSVFRSIGMSKKGINKMLILESFFLGLKVLLISLPISIIIIKIMSEIFIVMTLLNKNTVISYPVFYIVLTILVVLLLIVLVTIYSINKIKKKNIVDSIRNENI